MDLSQLQRKLFAAARTVLPKDAVPYAFEKRVMARLQDAPMADAWLLWGRALWRAAAACVALSILLSVWSVWPANEAEPVTLESAVFAAAEEPGEVW
jgi:hypothetical protein